VLCKPHWEWVARQVPPQILDPYRVEAILRTTPRGRRNVFLLGDSTMDAGRTSRPSIVPSRTRDCASRTLSIGGSPTLAFGFLARAIAALEPSAVVLLVSPYSLRSRGFYARRSPMTRAWSRTSSPRAKCWPRPPFTWRGSRSRPTCCSAIGAPCSRRPRFAGAPSPGATWSGSIWPRGSAVDGTRPAPPVGP